jgi:hypothetical protein
VAWSSIVQTATTTALAPRASRGSRGFLMRASSLAGAVLALPIVLAGCPALLSDWTISSSGPNDAAADSQSSGSSGSSSGSSSGEADASPPEDAGTQDVGGGSSGVSSSGGSSSGTSSGSSSSSSSSSSGSPSGPCDGGPLYTHNAGNGVTWTDCVPTGTHTGAEATKACEAWCAANDCVGEGSTDSSPCFEGQVCNSEEGVAILAQPTKTTMIGWWYTGPNAGTLFNVSSNEATCTEIGMWN